MRKLLHNTVSHSAYFKLRTSWNFLSCVQHRNSRTRSRTTDRSGPRLRHILEALSKKRPNIQIIINFIGIKHCFSNFSSSCKNATNRKSILIGKPSSLLQQLFLISQWSRITIISTFTLPPASTKYLCKYNVEKWLNSARAQYFSHFFARN